MSADSGEGAAVFASQLYQGLSTRIDFSLSLSFLIC